MQRTTAFIIYLLLMASCSPERYVKPLAKKQQAVNVNFGGPLFTFDNTTIPMPFLTANYGYGFDSTLTGFASLNITSAFYGNFQTELGATKQFLKQNKYLPALSVSPVLNTLYRNKNVFRVFPQLDLNAFWEYGKRKNYFYLGVNHWLELASKRTLNENQPYHWFFTPVAGHNFTGKKWNILLEAKIIAPNLSNQKLVVEYKTPFKNNGAFGVYIGYTRKF